MRRGGGGGVHRPSILLISLDVSDELDMYIFYELLQGQIIALKNTVEYNPTVSKCAYGALAISVTGIEQ